MTKNNRNVLLAYRYKQPEDDSCLFAETPPTVIEICLDEVGRGPLFGRLYVAGVVLPPNSEDFNGEDIKDSKKFSSKLKMKKVADYIKQNCRAYHIDFIEANVIDEINILQAVFRSMHTCIRHILQKLDLNLKCDNVLILADGNAFAPFCTFDETLNEMVQIPHVTVEKGDATYMGIASASIIAKVAHDEYIYELCEKHPILNERYDLLNNVGYGTKKHLDGIRKYGITEFHRKTFGICKEY